MQHNTLIISKILRRLPRLNFLCSPAHQLHDQCTRAVTSWQLGIGPRCKILSQVDEPLNICSCRNSVQIAHVSRMKILLHNTVYQAKMCHTNHILRAHPYWPLWRRYGGGRAGLHLSPATTCRSTRCAAPPCRAPRAHPDRLSEPP